MAKSVLEKKAKGEKSNKKEVKPVSVTAEQNLIVFAPPRIDYPLEGEVLQNGVYAIRISAEEGSDVQISVSGSEWQRCRHAVGHWWFD